MGAGDMAWMIAPDGRKAKIPTANVQEAVKGGFKRAASLWTKEGKQALIPIEQAGAALKSGDFLASKPTPKEDAKNKGHVDLSSLAGQGQEFKQQLGQNLKNLPSAIPHAIGNLVMPHDTMGATRAQEVKMGPTGRILYNIPADIAQYISDVGTKAEQGHLGSAGADVLTGKIMDKSSKLLAEGAKATPGVIGDAARKMSINETKKWADVFKDYDTGINHPANIAKDVNKMMDIHQGVDFINGQLKKYGGEIEKIARTGDMMNTIFPQNMTGTLYSFMDQMYHLSSSLKTLVMAKVL